ncbi:hypothetical protein BH23ACT10_BH23ACT10_12590 [soil metagenome]
MYIDPAFAARMQVDAAAAQPFRQLVDAAGRTTDTAGVHHLRRIAYTLAQAPQLWRPLAHHDPHRRWYAHLMHTMTFEVWLIGWDVGQDTDLHDHGGSSGAVAVCDGTLDEQHTVLGRGGSLRTRTHARSTVLEFGSTYVHNLGNTGPATATSVHVYAPPLHCMNFYEHTDAGLRPLRSVPVAGPDPGVVRPVAVAAGLAS